MQQTKYSTNTQVLTIEFKGHLPTYKDYDYQHSKYENEGVHPSDLVKMLQSRENEIKSQISSELRRRTSYTADIEVEITFRMGSVEWEGVLYVLNWFAAVGGTIGLVDYMSRSTIHVVNKVIKKSLPREAGAQRIETDVTNVIVPPDVTNPELSGLQVRPQHSLYPIQQFSPEQVGRPESNKIIGFSISAVSVLTLVNTILLIFILFSFIK